MSEFLTGLKVIVVFISLCVIGIGIGKFIIYTYDVFSEPEVKAGQVWRYTLNKDNPFKEPKHLDMYVLAVKGDYVKYIENQKDTISGRKILFKYYTLIQETPFNTKYSK